LSIADYRLTISRNQKSAIEDRQLQKADG